MREDAGREQLFDFKQEPNTSRNSWTCCWIAWISSLFWLPHSRTQMCIYI